MATVLIVEDDEHVRVLTESIVRAHGFQTLAADGSEQALAFFNDPDQQIDLLDCAMRSTAGWTWLRRPSGDVRGCRALHLRPKFDGYDAGPLR